MLSSKDTTIVRQLKKELSRITPTDGVENGPLSADPILHAIEREGIAV
jgi:hypothetical protein